MEVFNHIRDSSRCWKTKIVLYLVNESVYIERANKANLKLQTYFPIHRNTNTITSSADKLLKLPPSSRRVAATDSTGSASTLMESPSVCPTSPPTSTEFPILTTKLTVRDFRRCFGAQPRCPLFWGNSFPSLIPAISSGRSNGGTLNECTRLKRESPGTRDVAVFEAASSQLVD